MDTTRVLICKKIRLAASLCCKAKQSIDRKTSRTKLKASEAWNAYQKARQDAAIWNIATCIAKCEAGIGCGGQHPASHAPKQHRDSYHSEAARRLIELRGWVNQNRQAAETEAAPLIAEYEARAQARAARVAAEAVAK